MTTAVKRRRRRNQAHNRIDDLPRTPSGQLTRAKKPRDKRNERIEAMTQREAQSVVVEARMRHHGLSERDASNNLAGTVIGRLFMQGQQNEEVLCISQDQYEAAVWFLERRNDFKCAHLSPDAFWKNLGRGGEPDEESYETFVKSARSIWRQIMEALQEKQTQTRTAVIEGVRQFVIDDRYMPHLLGELREGLNAIGQVKERS